ncbi:MAG: TetR/AcrR family transcriptional regulator [Porphyromonadaceae bacterium]|nr:TetR/AcrR family transcriptional regulator [Porphyromonadaceae bacterium]
MKKNNEILYDKSTEEKIKIAAEKLFMEQGFSSTRTRDIADAADINLALLNYYYRSKKNLFDTIMMEKLDMFFDTMLDVISENQDDYFNLLNGLMNKTSDLMTAQPKLSYF